MKNGKYIFLLICTLSLTFVLGLFVGRNTNDDYKELEYNEHVVSSSNDVSKLNNKLDINTATMVQLMELPGIGEVIAERIIAFRTINGPFSTVDQLLNVEGIGTAKLEQIETYICIGG